MEMKINLVDFVNQLSLEAEESNATISITQLQQEEFYNVLDVEIEKTNYGDKLILILKDLEDSDNEIRARLTDYWNNLLLPIFDDIKETIHDIPHQFVYLGMKPYYDYNRADIEFKKVDDKKNHFVNFMKEQGVLKK